MCPLKGLFLLFCHLADPRGISATSPAAHCREIMLIRAKRMLILRDALLCRLRWPIACPAPATGHPPELPRQREGHRALAPNLLLVLCQNATTQL